MTIQPLTCVAALKFKVPVKMKLTRQESMQLHTKRHPMDVTLTTACDENGILFTSICLCPFGHNFNNSQICF